MGINIFSGSEGLGAALTNPTELARRKGTLLRSYPVLFGGTRFSDAETAYKTYKAGNAAKDDLMMADIICQKFRQHPELLSQVTELGGVAWLESCSHFTGAQTPAARSWEGQGTDSRFIRNLIQGYRHAVSGQSVGPHAQFCLF